MISHEKCFLSLYVYLYVDVFPGKTGRMEPFLFCYPIDSNSAHLPWLWKYFLFLITSQTYEVNHIVTNFDLKKKKPEKFPLSRPIVNGVIIACILRLSRWQCFIRMDGHNLLIGGNFFAESCVMLKNVVKCRLMDVTCIHRLITTS